MAAGTVNGGAPHNGGATDGGRQPPHDADAEQAVLGVCLLGVTALVDEARRHLPTKPNPFYNNRNARIWEAVTALADGNITPEPIAVADRARTASGTWKDPEDAVYLASLLERAQAGVDAHMVAGHARIVARHAAARTILERTTRIQHLARELSTDDPETLAAVLADLQADVDAVAAAAPARPKPRLEFLSVRELSDRVAAAGPRTWLLRGLWPNGDYGVHAAEPKAGKTWNTCDLAVAVSTGSLWMGHVNVETQGHVLMLAGEGGEIDLHQRLWGVAAQFSFDLNDLPITVCPRAPHITNPTDMRQVRDAIERTQPALVTLDPLYLAARGANMASLYEMGAALEEIQHVCQDAGASLWVATHFNRKEGKGQSRITGAGPAEWGRVLSTATIVSRKEDRETKETTVISEMSWIGGSIADHTMRVVRRIRRVTPDDINSPYVYSVEIEEGPGGASADDNAIAERMADLAPAGIKLYDALKAVGKPSTQRQIVDQVAKMHGHGLARGTVSKHLNILSDAKLVDRVDRGVGTEALWCLAGHGDPVLISDGDTR